MELRHLHYFIAVAEHENVTRAAAALHVAQPSLSRQIRDLEDELGVELFERQANSLRLSEAGRVFLDEAREVVRRAERAVLTVRAAAAGRAGEIRLGFAPSLAIDLLPRILREFQQQYPEARVIMQDLSTREMLDGVLEQSLHLALAVGVEPHLLEGLEFDLLERHRVCVAMAHDHPLAGRTSVTLPEVETQPWVVFRATDYPEYHAWMRGIVAPAGGRLEIAEEHDGVFSLIAAVESGRGVALVSERLGEMSGRRLTIVPLEPPPPPLLVGIAKRQEPAAPMVGRFVEVARQLAARQ